MSNIYPLFYMHLMKRFITVVFIYLFSISMFSEGITDSLLQKIKDSSNEKRLELINQLALSQQDSKEVLKIAEFLEQESKKQENMEFLSKSYAFKAKYYTYRNDIDSVIFYSELMRELSKKYNMRNFHHYYYIISTQRLM